GTIQASGAGSRVDLSHLTSLPGTPNTINASVAINALAGGVVDLSEVTSIPGGAVRVLADGADSRVDLSALTTMVASGFNPSGLEVRNSGTILVNSGLTSLDRV